jgi:predicted RNA-binding Zn-ribbon protein involved in translation (DUF1610 family)
MDMTSLAAAQASIKALAGLARSIALAVVDHQMKDKLIEIQQGILDVQSKLADATEERLNLVGEVAELRQKLRDFEAAGAALDSYELHEMAPGQFLYKSKDTEHALEHFACPQCHNAGKVTVLQSKKTGRQQTLYGCATPSCRFQLTVGPADPLEPINYRSDWRV